MDQSHRCCCRRRRKTNTKTSDNKKQQNNDKDNDDDDKQAWGNWSNRTRSSSARFVFVWLLTWEQNEQSLSWKRVMSAQVDDCLKRCEWISRQVKIDLAQLNGTKSIQANSHTHKFLLASWEILPLFFLSLFSLWRRRIIRIKKLRRKVCFCIVWCACVNCVCVRVQKNRAKKKQAVARI